MLLYIERGESMKKFTSLVACLIGVLGLSSCTNTYSNYIDSDNTDAEKPAMMKEIKFDNTFIQTNNATWPIAFKSYYIKNEALVINGSFCIPIEVEGTNIKELESNFNKIDNLPYVVSYSKFTNDIKNVVYSNTENTRWILNKNNDINLYSFVLNIDLSPLVENDRLLGELIINSNFNVFYNFNGEQI